MQELAVLAARTAGMQQYFTAIADNVANANTHGYKRMDIQFEELVSKPKGNATASYVADRGIVVDYRSGGFETTGNTLDLALGGKGFFGIQVGNTTQYTRKGQFLLDSDGRLVTPSGNAVLDTAGQPILLPQDVQKITIATDGTVATENGAVGQIGVFDFTQDDLGKLERTGDANFLPQLGATAQVLENANIKQGMLEASNVNAVQEMVTMQDVSKAYQNSLKMMDGLEQLESRAIQALGRTN